MLLISNLYRCIFFSCDPCHFPQLVELIPAPFQRQTFFFLSGNKASYGRGQDFFSFAKRFQSINHNGLKPFVCVVIIYIHNIIGSALDAIAKLGYYCFHRRKGPVLTQSLSVLLLRVKKIGEYTHGSNKCVSSATRAMQLERFACRSRTGRLAGHRNKNRASFWMGTRSRVASYLSLSGKQLKATSQKQACRASGALCYAV